MLQIGDIEEIKAEDIPKLLDKVKPILDKRVKLHKKYSREASPSKVMYSDNDDSTKIPFEKFITDLAAGYTAGDPSYTVDLSKDEEKNKVLAELLDKKEKGEDYQKGMEILIEYITKYNDDNTENYDLIHDLFELTSCYEIIYENEDNEIVYSKYDPLQTVATWDYNLPANLTGLIRTWDEENLNGKKVTKVEITDKNGSRIYSVNGQAVSEEFEERNNASWGDVPAFAVETDYAIFEMAEDIITAYEQLIQNVRNTYQYNDADCKLMLMNYIPENPMLIDDGNGNMVTNPARTQEDNMWINARALYVGENGNVTWLTKPMDAFGVETILKTYIDLMFQLCGIPNTSDLAFNSTDLNASAIDRKFYVMNMATENVVAQLKKAYLRRWELIFNRINLKKNTDFDFRDIDIDIPKNLPPNDSELTDQLLKLRDMISNQTIVEKLGYNYLSEKEKMDREAEDNMMANIENMKRMEDAGLSEEEPNAKEEESSAV